MRGELGAPPGDGHLLPALFPTSPEGGQEPVSLGKDPGEPGCFPCSCRECSGQASSWGGVLELTKGSHWFP